MDLIFCGNHWCCLFHSSTQQLVSHGVTVEINRARLSTDLESVTKNRNSFAKFCPCVLSQVYCHKENGRDSLC